MKITLTISLLSLSFNLVGCSQSNGMPEVTKENCSDEYISKIDDEKTRGIFHGKCARISNFTESPKKSW